jgi:NADPH-dependent glutamate synthase beta subunit-like oxidoreductase/NAD(P)H-flavin reductase
MSHDQTAPSLGFGLSFADLYRRDGLERVDAAFLAAAEPGLADRLASARAAPDSLADKDASELLLALAPHFEDFVAALFGIHAALAESHARHDALAPLYAAKRQFVQRRALKEVAPEEAATFDGDALAADIARRMGTEPTELAFARAVLAWMDEAETHAEDLAAAARWAAWNVGRARRAVHAGGVLFRIPGKHDPLALVPAETVEVPGDVAALAYPHQRYREGFALTDPGTDLAGALDQIHYCIFCHHQGRDSCSKGLIDRKAGGLAKNAVGTVLAGCPLEEKISEMHEAKGRGLTVAALAIVAIDNPMAAGTGHRICNDCMAACIYQGQNRDPVDIPQAESRTLKDVLALPWGFEIHSLLTRWNPLNLRRWLPRPATGRTVLVVGLGPAGFTLAHHLLQDGHAVAAVDGLKIEPLPADLSGIDDSGGRVPFRAIRDAGELWEDLNERVSAGFGGVAEYGITARWDKNFLKIIRLTLERRSDFALYGGVRFGGALTLDDAFRLGFDHVALATGAGKPTILTMPDGLARGVRQASDFLMALQLTGAARADTVANLQLRLPVVVIGGGLTAIDTCTEALAYYPVQVEKFLSRAERLGLDAVRATWTDADREIGEDFFAHARALRAERAAATVENREPRIRDLLDSWGGALIAYRRGLIDSPAYRNHEEVHKALEEGIRFAEELTPVAVRTDRHGAARGLEVTDGDGTTRLVPARTILVAAGTVPNTTLARERAGIHLDGKYFQAVDETGAPVTPEKRAKPSAAHVLMHVDGCGNQVSFFGDLHPSYAGNVVSAMASAKQGHPIVTRALMRRPPSTVAAPDLFRRLNEGLRARVHAVHRLTPTIVEVVVHAPMAARAFRPGQFYRLQNFETLAPRIEGTVLAMEGLALTGAWTDAERGLVGLIVLEMGGSSNLVALLRPDEPVVLMGPTGAPTEIPENETVLLAGGGLGNAVLFSIGAALRRAGSRVLYFAGYRDAADRFKVADIEAASDLVVWCVDAGEPFVPNRPQDRSVVGTIVAAMEAYGAGRLGDVAIPMSAVDRIVAIGSDRMMAAIGAARHAGLAPYLKPGHLAIASINSPMQCMMKEICAQCLQRHVDPLTGAETVVFTCFNQDQALDRVDFANLADRLSQNGTSEKLTRQWIAHCVARLVS